MITKNNWIQDDIKNITIYLKKDEILIGEGVDKLNNKLNSHKGLNKNFAFIDTSDYTFEDQDYFLDFVYLLSHKTNKGSAVITNHQNLTQQKTLNLQFIYFNGIESQESFESNKKFRHASLRLQETLEMVMPADKFLFNPFSV